MTYAWLSILLLLSSPPVSTSPEAERRPLGDHGQPRAPTGPETSPPNAADARVDAMTLTVGSYNAWLLPLGSRDLRSRTERMGPALAEVAADILCLQEVWDERAAHALRGMLAPRLPFGVISGGGLTTLARWPIVHTRFVPFSEHPAMSLVERFAKKGFLVTVHMTPLGPLQVVNTHLIWEGRRAPGEPLEGRAHWHQLNELAEHLRHPSEVPTVVCGDFNHRAIEGERPSAEFALWLSLGFVDAAGTSPDADGRWTPRARTRAGYPRGPNIAPRGSDPDYILARPGRAVAVESTAFSQALDAPETALSDHNLLIARLALSRR